MKTQKASFFGIGLIAVAVLMSACASAPPPPIEGWATNYEFLDNTTQTQEKENVKITLTPFNELDKSKHPELFRFNIESWGEGWKNAVKPSKFWFPPDPSGNQYADTFVGMPAFFVTLENKTGHILRMSDARLYLVVDGKDPVPAINKFGNLEWAPTELDIYRGKKPINIPKSALEEDGSLIDYITRHEFRVVQWLKKVWKTDPKYKNYPWYPFQIVAVTAVNNSKAYKLINEVGREILPGFSLNGVLCFPFRMEKGQQARVMLYDVTTETDEAGNPTKKTQFEFEFKHDPKYVKYNELTRKWEDSTPPEVTKK